MENLKIALVQSPLHWEQPDKNREMFAQKLEEVTPGTDLVVLPEMFATGFSMKPELFSEDMDGISVQWLRQMAARLNAVVTGSLIIKENNRYYNRLFWMPPSGNFKTYDKRHLFSLVGEENHYTAGKEQLIVELKGFKIMPLICYDLRFPVWSRNTSNYDLVLYVANWPERRRYPWSLLLKARAIENLTYVVGLNRVGKDGNGISHSGDSVCINPLGELVAHAQPGADEVLQFEIKKDIIATARNRFGFLNDRDAFEIIV